MSDQERERKAFEALIVLRLRSGCTDGEKSLTDEERATLKCLNPNFINGIAAQADEPEEAEEPVEEKPRRGREMVGMNRAADPNASKDDIDSKRDDVLEQMEEDENARRDREGG